MIYFCDNLRQLRDARDAMIRAARTDTARVGLEVDVQAADGGGPAPHLDGTVQLELVYVDGDGRIVGDEANDYEPKAGERAAIRVG